MSATLSSVPTGQGDKQPNLRPYIGLRYFEESDASLFYGRDEHTAEILSKVAHSRFVAILGSSGSGKSSLVRAGLLPELRSGMIPQAGTRWRVVEFKPGNAPLGELAEALHSSLGVTNSKELVEEGPLGIVHTVKAAQLPENTNLLLIADQFEEVFRFQREERDKGRENEAVEQCQALVRKLLDAAEQTEIPIYVLLVMRSDYLGECAQFHELPGRISRSMYLVPRLRRDQVQEVITAPVGNNIEPALVQELLGKAGSDPDQLPRLQHLLHRVWTLAKGRRLTMRYYRQAGGWESGLAKNLNEVLTNLTAREGVCARLFQQLSDVDERNRIVRRRAPLNGLVRVCGAEVIEVIAAFRAEGFLRSGDPVDITHECILRNWNRVKKWLRKEIKARDFYREIKAREKRKAMLSGTDLGRAQKYLDSGHYSAAWARRYGTRKDFDRVRDFVAASTQFEQKAKQREQRLRYLLIALGAAFVLAMAATTWLLWANNLKVKEANGELHREQQKLNEVYNSLQEYIGKNEAARSGQDTYGKASAAKPNPASSTFSARELAQLYDFPTELNGQGQTIALIELGGGYASADLQAYFAQLNLPVPSITFVSVDGGKNQPGSDADAQITGDIEVAGSVAPAAEIVIYSAPNTNQGFLHALTAATRDTEHSPSILSIGWGSPEQSWTQQSVQAMNQALQNAGSRSITVVTAAGNSGVTDGLPGLRAVDFPASSPWVLACGGTRLTASNGVITSETVWNDGENSGATGGGFSTIFAAPNWQANLSLASGQKQTQQGTIAKLSGRGTPDVAANASPKSGYRIYLKGANIVTGGTSVTAPFWAGLMALINQGLGRNVGFLNPILYQKLGPAGVFRNITEGNNSYGNVKGYSAGPGWNAVTGWGSPDGRKLLNALKAHFGTAQ